MPPAQSQLYARGHAIAVTIKKSETNFLLNPIHTVRVCFGVFNCPSSVIFKQSGKDTSG